MQIVSFKFTEILSKEFISSIKQADGKVYFVGGCVRDLLLKKEPKDFDLVVANIPIDELKKILSKHGEVKVVGESFGVIVFIERSTKFECEIALPRKDYLDKRFKGHRAIIAQSDPYLPIEVDLERRDFTINSMAVDEYFQLIDPFNGMADLQLGIIRPTSLSSFIEDPLRIIRALQFAGRFVFHLSDDCYDMIRTHAHLVKDVSAERVYDEFQKVITKTTSGGIARFLDFIHDSGVFEQLFGFEMSDFTMLEADRVKSMPEMLQLMVKGETSKIKRWGDFFTAKLKISRTERKEMDSFEWLNTARNENIMAHDNRKVFFKALKYTPQLFDSFFFELPGIDKFDFERGKYPKTLSDVDITSIDLMKLGLMDERIGMMQKVIVDKIMEDEVANDKPKILKFVKSVLAHEQVS